MYLLWILRHTIETFCMLILGASTIKFYIPLGKAFLSAFLLGNFVFIVRMLPLKFGVHTILCTVVILFIYHSIFSLPINRAAPATFYPLIILTILEGFYFNFVLNIEKFDQLTEWHKLLLSLPPLFLLAIIAGGSFLLTIKTAKKKNSSTSFGERRCI